MKAALLEALLAERAARRPAALLTSLSGKQQRLVRADDDRSALPAPLSEAVQNALRFDRAAPIETQEGRIFVQPFNPSLRLAIVGAVHIGQHLASFAARTGYEVSVIDPRTAFASEARFPGTAVSHDWPDEALAAMPLDARTAVVTLTHDPKLDDPALAHALVSPAFYVGALGSRATQAKRVDRLRERGLSDAAIGRIHGPVGLDLGARSPAEIALSILAQITQRLRQPQAPAPAA